MKKLHYERLPVWARQSYTGAHLIVRPLGQRCCCWWWRATVRTLPSLSLICRIDICVLILSLVLFSPLVHIFFFCCCVLWESLEIINDDWTNSTGVKSLRGYILSRVRKMPHRMPFRLWRHWIYPSFSFIIYIKEKGHVILPPIAGPLNGLIRLDHLFAAACCCVRARNDANVATVKS